MIPFIRKLRHGAHLTGEDQAVLAKLAEPARRVERGDIVPDGVEPRYITLILEGWAYCYKQLENGKRQITCVFLPGDLSGPFGVLPQASDYPLAALTPVLLAHVQPQAIRAAAQGSPRIDAALWRDMLVSDAVRREHMVSLGRRLATERLAHFFCEAQLRLEAVGLCDRSSYEMPLTQADLADLFGLSVVHVNRSLQELRGSGILSLRGRRLTILDVRALRELAMFDPGYLSLDGTVPAPAAADAPR